MGRDIEKNESIPLAEKRIAFMQLPDLASFFLDSTDSGYFVRIETEELRIVMPIIGDLQLVLGGLVDEFIEAIVELQTE